MVSDKILCQNLWPIKWGLWKRDGYRTLLQQQVTQLNNQALSYNNCKLNYFLCFLGPGIAGVAFGQDVVGAEGAPILKTIYVKHHAILAN